MNSFSKVLFLFLILYSSISAAQDTTTSAPHRKFKIHIGFGYPKHDSLRKQKTEKFYKNEVSFNVFNLLYQRYEFNYERLIRNNQGVIVGLTRNDGFHFDTPNQFSDKSETTSLKLGYIGYFSDKNLQGFYINPYLAYRKNLRVYRTREAETNYFGTGVNIGYKFLVHRVSIKTQLGALRNWYKRFDPSSKKNYLATEVPIFVGIGFRF